MKLVNVQSLLLEIVFTGSHKSSFVETLVEKAQYEEAAEKSVQLETKVCRGYLYCFNVTVIKVPVMIIVSFYLYPRDICCILYPRDHCLFDDSNAWHLHML